MNKLTPRKQGFKWLFEVEFDLPTLFTTVDSTKLYCVIKKSLSTEDADAEAFEYLTLTDEDNLTEVIGQGNVISAYIPIPVDETKDIVPGEYYIEFFWERDDDEDERYDVDETYILPVEQSVKDVPT